MSERGTSTGQAFRGLSARDRRAHRAILARELAHAERRLAEVRQVAKYLRSRLEREA